MATFAHDRGPLPHNRRRRRTLTNSIYKTIEPRATACTMLWIVVVSLSSALTAEPIEPIRRVLPPEGIELSDGGRASLQAELDRLSNRLAKAAAHPLLSDVRIYHKAVDYALRHGEFYRTEEVPRAADALRRANARLDQLLSGGTPWTNERGLVVRGYRSSIDGSVQPYGLVIPERLDLSRPVPLYIWLHGRGDRTTDLHFIHRRQTREGRIAPTDAIVLHPFGRHCMGFKSAGEVDVLESVEHVKSQYKIDADRIVLMGFSMGGAGCWHVGAHYTDRWAAMSPGAGFAETARYNRLAVSDYPPAYEQTLWGLYDVPGYVRNLFNLPVVVYSGEKDRQMQAARVMEEAFDGEGRTLPHIIGPGMGHQYHPESLRRILQVMKRARDKGLDRAPERVSLQTRTLRYNRLHWVEALGLQKHWTDARVDARVVDQQRQTLEVHTKNITAMRLSPWKDLAGARMTVDDQTITILRSPSVGSVVLVRRDAKWTTATERWTRRGLAKRPGLQGPIDDVFLEPFLVVTPGGRSRHAKVQRWIDFELARFVDRWRALYRGELRVKQDRSVTADDVQNYHLILWGDPASNQLTAKIADQLPIRWTEDSVRVGKHDYDSRHHVPVLIYPNPLNGHKYVVLNSGPTFREGHDRTNSLQNPKLPDWAVVDLSQPPDRLAPGRIAAADFFDEQWQLRSGGP